MGSFDVFSNRGVLALVSEFHSVYNQSINHQRFTALHIVLLSAFKHPTSVALQLCDRTRGMISNIPLEMHFCWPAARNSNAADNFNYVTVFDFCAIKKITHDVYLKTCPNPRGKRPKQFQEWMNAWSLEGTRGKKESPTGFVKPDSPGGEIRWAGPWGKSFK